MNTSFEDHPSSGVIQVANRNIPCVVEGILGRRLLVETREPIEISAPVSLEFNDALFLGEVVTCSSEPEGTRKLEIRVEQILTGLQSLMNLRANLLGEPVPEPQALLPAGASR